jgi:hypothetical protein
MQKRYQVDKQRAVQQFRRFATEINPNIQMILLKSRLMHEKTDLNRPKFHRRRPFEE